MSGLRDRHADALRHLGQQAHRDELGGADGEAAHGESDRRPEHVASAGAGGPHGRFGHRGHSGSQGHGRRGYSGLVLLPDTSLTVSGDCKDSEDRPLGGLDAAAYALAPAHRPARPGDGLRGDLPGHGHPRVPVGHEPGALLRAVPHLRRPLDRAAARRDRRVRAGHPEEVRRHRAAARPGVDPRAALRRRPTRDPADQPDARRLRHQQRRHALRAVHVRGRAEALDGRLRLAALHAGRGRGEHPLLPRARPADGDQGDPGDLRRVRAAARRLRGDALPLRPRLAAGGRRDDGADEDVLPARGRRARRRVLPGADGRAAAEGVRLPGSARRGGPGVAGRAAAPWPGRAAAAGTAYARCTCEDLRWIRTYPDGYDVEQLGTFPRGCPVPHGDAAAAS